MSAESQVFETAIIISPAERLREDVDYKKLPLHINVVDPFTADTRQSTRLALCLAETMFRNRFEITGPIKEEYATERLQRLGGSILHNVREDIIGKLDRLKIVHDNQQWPDGFNETWYSGTWRIPSDRRTEISQVHIAQETPSSDAWRILKSYELKVPGNDFRQDPLYIDSRDNPVNRRKS